MNTKLTECAVQESNLQPTIWNRVSAGEFSRVPLGESEDNTSESPRKAAEHQKSNDKKAAIRQTDLFPSRKEPEVDAPYQLGSDTSRDAAREIQPRTQAMRANILTAIRAAGSRGVTRKELEGITGYVTPTLCARLNELEFELGEIRKWTVGDPPKTVKREGCAVYLSKSVRVAA